MTEVLPASATDVYTSQSKHVFGQSKPRLPSSSVAIPPPSNVRNGHLSLDILSPVNQNGSFEFDRVLKSGEVYKRTRKTRVFYPTFHSERPLICVAMEKISPRPPSESSLNI